MPNKDQAAKINRTEKPATRSSASLAKIEDQLKFSAAVEAKQSFQQTRIDPQALQPHDLLRLQRTVGNHAVQRLLATRTIQAKLTVGAAHDPYEEEADQVAEQVMRMPASPALTGVESRVQRKVEEDEEELQAKPLTDTSTPIMQRTAQEEELQTKRASAADSFDTGAEFEDRLNTTRGGGSPLPAGVRAFMEPRFGADFSGVRLHTGSESAQLNRGVSAHAFTLGSDIYLGEGKTDLTSNDGKQLLAHELTHVVQQSGGTLQRRSTLVAAQLQRLVKIKFEEPEHEMEDFDTAAAKIVNVNAERDQKRVAVENKSIGTEQKAHTTSHTVFTNMFVRDLDKKTWAQAWQMLKDKYQFLHNLVTQWYADNTLKAGANATLKNQLPGLLQTQITNCDNELQRGGHPITGTLWAARPKAGTKNDWQYYDHQPDNADGVDPATHLIKPWKPLLNSTDVHRLEEACETWMELRGQIPWTSVDTQSYVTGDMAGPGQVEAAAQKHAAKLNLSNVEAKEISDAIIKTFDFFPPSLTQARTYEHAAAVAARHIVEHFQYHASIKPAWRDTIAAQFLISWEEKIDSEKGIEEAQTLASQQTHTHKKKAAKIEPGRRTDGLGALQIAWNNVKIEYNRVYLLLKAALV